MLTHQRLKVVSKMNILWAFKANIKYIQILKQTAYDIYFVIPNISNGQLFIGSTFV